jgi:hypothetical protein
MPNFNEAVFRKTTFFGVAAPCRFERARRFERKYLLTFTVEEQTKK